MLTVLHATECDAPEERDNIDWKLMTICMVIDRRS